MHKHVEWDAPGRDSVIDHYAQSPNTNPEPGPGDILSTRYKGKVVRIKVQAYVDGTSIGDVAALIDPQSGERLKALGELTVGDTVRVPDDKRAFEPQPQHGDDKDDD